MTTVYFIRHAQPDFSVKNTSVRSLTEEGLADRLKAADFLENSEISAIYSSPYKRAYDTVLPIAERRTINIKTDDRLRERSNGEGAEPFEEYAEKQWNDFSYKRPNGESLGETQNRNIAALREILAANRNKTIAIGTHSACLSTIINYYKPEFRFADFMRILNFMPFIVKFVFEGEKIISIEELFHIEKVFINPDTKK